MKLADQTKNINNGSNPNLLLHLSITQKLKALFLGTGKVSNTWLYPGTQKITQEKYINYVCK